MFKKMLIKDTDKESVLANIFYQKNNYHLKGVELYGLSYLGEYLERYESAGIKPLEIVRAIACEPMCLPKYEIYDGQLEGFIDVIESILDSDNSFINKLCYGIFLYKIGKTAESKLFIKELIKDIELDKDFNVLTLSIASGNIYCSNDIREKIVKKLNSSSLCVNIEALIDLSVLFGLTYQSGISALKFIVKAYKLKESDFEEKDRFQFYKELKNIGTKNANYESTKKYWNISKQDYYFLCLKIAKETYSKGSTLNNALKLFTEAIRNNINVNSSYYTKFFEFKEELTLKDGRMYDYAGSTYGKDFSNVITLSKACFDNVEEDYYKEAICAYCNSINEISYEQICTLFYKDDFINYLSSIKDTISNEDINKISLEVLGRCVNKEICFKYFNLLKDIELEPSYKQIILLNSCFVDIDSFMEKFFIKKDDSSNMNFNILEDCTTAHQVIQNLSRTINDYNLTYASFKIAEYMIKNNVIANLYNVHALFISIYNKAWDYILSIDNDYTFKKYSIKILDDFCFMYTSSFYVDFIFKACDDIDAREALSLTEEGVREIINYVIDNKYLTDDSMLRKIKESYFSKEEHYISECTIKINALIKNQNSYKINSLLEDYKEFYNTGDESLQLKVRTILKDKLISAPIQNMLICDIEFFKNIVDKELLNIEDTLFVIKHYLNYNK